jgi:hypothetical protein
MKKVIIMAEKGRNINLKSLISADDVLLWKGKEEERKKDTGMQVHNHV